MTDDITFEGRVAPIDWGRATYTILRLPPDLVTALGKTRRVEGEIHNHPVNLALTRAPVLPDVFLWAGQCLLDRNGIAPGDPLEIRLRPAPDDVVDLPDDVFLALRKSDATACWGALTPGKQRGLLYPINSAKTAPTRATRIATLVATLTGAT
ncbi:MAG: YdeI/OmpD-associated family protein [Rhodobacteraceae bacterium]|nr:YdeI/OmpD-associated family protein [Paracoccaceae bacterium]